MTKKLSLLLLICFLSALNINAEVYEGSCGDNAKYTIDTETGVLSITGTGAMRDYKYNNGAPWYLYNFYYYIRTVNVADGITSIGQNFFYGCRNITSITIPNSVTSIGECAFWGCSGLTSITISNSVTSIGGGAFWGCSSLTSITIPNSVTSIGSSAFYQCSSLTSVSVESGNPNYDSRDNCNAIIETATNTLIVGCNNTVIPNSVTSIGSSAFYNCTSLTSVTIPNSVTSIGSSAFSSCSGLTSVTIPNSVTSIGSGAFSGCKGLTSVTIPNSVTSIGGSTFMQCSSLTSVTIPNSVTSIEYGAFYNCDSLTSVNIPNSVTSIGEKAFYDCSGLTKVTINSNNVLSTAYSSSASLKDIFGNQVKEYKIGDEVKSIGKYAFNQCTDLKTISIGGDVESIGDYAFANIPNLEKIYCYAKNVPTTSRSAFENSYLDYVTLYVLSTSLDAYSSTAIWKNAASILPLEDIKEKCATPTIIFENGKLSFSCETEGVKYVYNFSTPSESGDDGSNISMPEKLQVSVYAKKDGFENSDVATKEIDLGTSGIRGDLNGDGVVNMPDAMFIVNKMLKGKFPDEELEKAGLRFGFYGTIPGYFTINKIDIKGLRHDKFGTDMVGSSLRTSADMPTYDRADGSYTNVYFEDSNNNSSMNIVIEYSLDGNNYSYTYQTDLRDFKPNKNYTFIIGFTLHEIFVSYKVEDQDGPTQ